MFLVGLFTIARNRISLCSMSNKSPETDLGIEAEDQKSKALATREFLPISSLRQTEEQSSI